MYSSVLAKATVDEPNPPAIRTLPLGSRVAVADERATFMLAVPEVAKLLTGLGAAAGIAGINLSQRRDRIGGRTAGR